MKTKLLYILVLCMAVLTSACSEEYTYPPMIVPTATIKPNTTIAAMKEHYWSSERNYCNVIGQLSDGSNMIIKGRVVSNDTTGNIFKNLVIEDSTAAITIAINAYNLNESYHYGQNIVIDVTGLQIGGYNGLMQLGSESTYNGQPSMTFMAKELFETHAQPDGLADPRLIIPTVYTIPELTSAKDDQIKRCLTQSKIVKIENVSFVDAGKAFAPGNTSTDRYVVDSEGNRLNVRCSSYATFKNELIPSGTGNVTGILSFYGSDWQLLLNNLEGLEGFTPSTPADPNTPSGLGEGDGTAASPYNVAKAIEIAQLNGESSDKFVYTKGIVCSGSIDTNYGNATWDIYDNAEGIGQKLIVYRVKDINNQKFTDTNKVATGDTIVVYAPLINYKGNTPETGNGAYLYSINGQTGSSTPDTPVTPPVGDGDGSETNPYTVSQVQGGATGTSAWVKGYIVGWVDGQVLASGAKFNKDATIKTNLLVADSPDVTDVSQCIPVQLPAGDIRNALNLQDNPGNYKKEVALCGSLEKYFGTAGLKSVSAYKLDGNGGGTPDTPDTPGTGDKVTYRAADKVTSGKQYLIVAGDKAATPLTTAYGYIKVVDVTVSNGVVEAAESDAFTFTASGEGYTIKADGKYYYQTGTYNSFNVDAALPTDGGIWKVDIKDGAAVITNVSTSKTVQYDPQYTSFGCYPDVRGTYPVLYEKVEQ